MQSKYRTFSRFGCEKIGYAVVRLCACILCSLKFCVSGSAALNQQFGYLLVVIWYFMLSLAVVMVVVVMVVVVMMVMVMR